LSELILVPFSVTSAIILIVQTLLILGITPVSSIIKISSYKETKAMSGKMTSKFGTLQALEILTSNSKERALKLP